MAERDRKVEHIRICTTQDVQFKDKHTGFEDIDLVYDALPEMKLSEVDSRTTFLGHEFAAPLMVSGMTGGTAIAKQINKDIAAACEELGLGMGLGSQRRMVEAPALTETYYVRDVAPTIFLAGNLGATQARQYALDVIEKMLEDVGANALAIHLNPGQEAVQPEGMPDFKGCLKTIDLLARRLQVPVYVKEVGHGLAREAVQRLAHTKIKAVDVAGAGGTSWIGVDSLRGKKEVGQTFWDFGVPTAAALLEARQAWKGPLIASGGIRSGLDVVKALAMGASLGELAQPVIKAQSEGGREGVKKLLSRLVEEIRIGMFLVGAKDVKSLKQKKFIVYSGRLREWLDERKTKYS